jgi:hypothetical protein
MKRELIHQILTKNNVQFCVFGYHLGNVYFRWVDVVELELAQILIVDNIGRINMYKNFEKEKRDIMKAEFNVALCFKGR